MASRSSGPRRARSPPTCSVSSSSRRCSRPASPPPWIYVATAQALDEEMAARIAEHRIRRDPRWQTIEAPRELAAAIEAAEGDMLVDCLTLWLSNLLLAGADLDAESDKLERA